MYITTALRRIAILMWKKKDSLFVYCQECCEETEIVLSLEYAEKDAEYLLTDEDDGKIYQYEGVRLRRGNSDGLRRIWSQGEIIFGKKI